VFPRGGGREKIGGGNTVGVAPGRFSNLSNVTIIATIMKRE
jgi:hypothetical protein